MTRSDMKNGEHNEGMAPTLHATFIGRSGGHHGSPLGLETPKSDGLFVDTSAKAEDVIGMTPYPSPVSIRSPIHFALNSVFVAMSLISLIIFIIFFAVTLFILWDARSMGRRVFSNSTGVSMLLYHNERTSLTTVIAVAIDTRRQPPTGPRGIRIVHLVERPHLRCGCNLCEFVLGFSHPRLLRAIRQGT